MTVFIVCASLMVIVPLLLLAYNFLRPPTALDDEQRRRHDNILSAKAQLTALQSAQTALSRDEQSEYEDEIKAQLLADTQATGEAAPAPASRRSTFAGIAACAVALLAAPLVYGVYGTPQLLAAKTAKAAAPAASSLQEAVASLQQRLAENPEDSKSLMLLASSLMVLNRPAEAADYYGKARELIGDEPRLLRAHLEAAIAAGSANAKTEQVLSQALAVLPQDPVVLWLAGVWARENGELERALSYWYSAEAVISDPQLLDELGSAITELEQLAAGQATEANGDILRVHVEIAAESAAQIDASDVLFVFAKAAEGPPMPLAVHRARAGELPLTVVLDDSMAMVPQLKLSNFESYQVVARISKSGNASASRGDLFGSAAARRGDTLTLVINQITP